MSTPEEFTEMCPVHIFFFFLFLSYLPFSFLARGLLTYLLSLPGWLHKGLPSFFQSRPSMPN